jgi:bioA: adenosylmethionine-8-amino-7-oxononanoate transaminase
MIWYPYEQMKTMKAPYKILDAEGVHLYTKDQKLIDSISSWWCMIHGYKHPELTEAIKEQADRFCHVMLGGLTHEPVEKLSAKLQEFLPGDLDYCFFQIQEVLQWRSHLKWPFNTTPIREESAR